MDPLTQTIGLLRPRSLLWKQMEARGDWGVRFPANTGAVFCLVTKGACLFEAAGQAPRRLAEGDFVFLAAPLVWSLRARPDSLLHDMGQPHTGGEVNRMGAGEGPVTRTLGGHFGFGQADAALMRDVLPDRLVVESRGEGAARLRGLLDLIGDEAAGARPGRDVVLDRLLEVLLVEVIRHAAAAPGASRPGLLSGLADPRIATTLAALHADIRRDWTVAALAEVANLSRSAFAERFGRQVGLSPIDYLSRWRMAVARDALRNGASLAGVADAVGYQSVSAFSAAFTRKVGAPPSRYAAAARRT